MRVFYENLKVPDFIKGSTNSDNGVTLHILCTSVHYIFYARVYRINALRADHVSEFLLETTQRILNKHGPTNTIYRFVTVVYRNFGHYPSSCLLFRTQFNLVDLSVPHKKHITSPLRAQQVIATYRCVKVVYTCHNSGHYPSSSLI
jgi:hypothetical protein